MGVRAAHTEPGRPDPGLRLQVEIPGFWLWAILGLPGAFVLLEVMSPLFVLVALLVLVGPAGSRAERLGLTQSTAALVLFVGVLNLFTEGVHPLPWLVGGAVFGTVGALRYRAERQRSRYSLGEIFRDAPRGTHEAATSLLLALGAGVYVLLGVDAVGPAWGSDPGPVVAAVAIMVPAFALLLNGTRLRSPARIIAAALLGAGALAPPLAVTFYLLPSAAMMAAAAVLSLHEPPRLDRARGVP